MKWIWTLAIVAALAFAGCGDQEPVSPVAKGDLGGPSFTWWNWDGSGSSVTHTKVYFRQTVDDYAPIANPAIDSVKVSAVGYHNSTQYPTYVSYQKLEPSEWWIDSGDSSLNISADRSYTINCSGQYDEIRLSINWWYAGGFRGDTYDFTHPDCGDVYSVDNISVAAKGANYGVAFKVKDFEGNEITSGLDTIEVLWGASSPYDCSSLPGNQSCSYVNGYWRATIGDGDGTFDFKINIEDASEGDLLTDCMLSTDY
jgi:hypothetical protein